MQTLTLAELITTLEDHFGLQWVAGKNIANDDISKEFSWGSHPKVIGHFNPIHPSFVQVVGEIEMDFFNQLQSAEYQSYIQKLFGNKTLAVIVADALEVPEPFKNAADENKIALFGCSLASSELVAELRYTLGGLLADKKNLHGVLMEVTSVGVLLTGDSSIGKSELALELITRGHRLIADDAPEFSRIMPDIVSGSAPPLLENLLEVRGLGILNIREMYGDGATKKSKYLRLIIHLVPAEKHNNLDRLQSANSMQDVLGVNIHKTTLPVAPGRNLAVMVEAAVLDYLLKSRGYDAGKELIERQRQLLDESI